MDVHLKTDAILLSGSSFFSAAVEVTAHASEVTTVVAAMTVAGLSFSFCYAETAAVVVVAAEASAKHIQSKRGPDNGSSFSFLLFFIFALFLFFHAPPVSLRPAQSHMPAISFSFSDIPHQFRKHCYHQ